MRQLNALSSVVSVFRLPNWFCYLVPIPLGAYLVPAYSSALVEIRANTRHLAPCNPSHEIEPVSTNVGDGPQLAVPI